MARNKKGNQTLIFNNPVNIISAASVVGTKESDGPMKEWFDVLLDDDTLGQKSWEKAESEMLRESMMTALQKSGKEKSDIDTMLSGDLLNQLMSSSFMARDMHIPFLGLYGACSTMAESLLLGSMFIDGGYSDNVLVGASSHYCTAERQFRLPLEHGNQRPPSAQWTATAAGAMVISGREAELSEMKSGMKEPKQIKIKCATIGKITDPGIKDVNQMGAAMAPAAVDTLLNHFEDTKRDMDFYDIVLTGDLGLIGKAILKDLLADVGIAKDVLENKYDDCGAMMFEKEQDIHAGGSGCGCSASIFSSYVYKKMRAGEIKRALLLSTGALLSTISPLQGESIPAIAHGVVLETEEA